MQNFYRLMFVVSAAVVAAGIAISIVFGVNYAPALIWGSEVLLVSPYLTGIPSLIAGAIAFGVCFAKIQKWLDDGIQSTKGTPASLQLIFAITSLLIGLFCIYISSNGLRSQFFKVKWDEEILLSNGELITLQRQRTYERRGFRIEKYKDARLVNSTLIFEPTKGEPKVTFTTTLNPVYLNFFDNKWYLVLSGRDEYRNQNATEPDWGKNYNTLGQRLVVLDGQQFIPANWDTASTAIVMYNLITDEEFDVGKYYANTGHKISVAEKLALMQKYFENPWGADPLRITRPLEHKRSTSEEYRIAIKDLLKDSVLDPNSEKSRASQTTAPEFTESMFKIR